MLLEIENRLKDAQGDKSRLDDVLRAINIEQSRYFIDIKVKEEKKLFAQLRIIEKLLEGHFGNYSKQIEEIK
jgi:hypothetical protein